jgi:hypothetical protein
MKHIAGNGKHCLKLKLGGVLTLTGFYLGGRPSLFRLEILLLVGDDPIRKLVLYQKDFGWMAFLDLDPEVLGSLWLMASATWGGGGLLWLKASMIGESRSCPF